MSKIKIVTDSTADIPPDLVAELGIEVVPVLLHIDDNVYRSGVDISNEEFFELMTSGGHNFSTAAPSLGVFEQVYRKYSVEYDNVFSIHLSNRLGDVYQTALQARSKVPVSTTRITITDSKSASMGLGAVVVAAARFARDGASPEEVGDFIQTMLRHSHVVFFVDTMDYLEKSGRLSLAAAVLGSMQRIKPLMILNDGEIVPYERTRTRAKAIEGLYTFVEDFPNVQEVTALYATTPEDIEKLLEKIEPIFPREQVQIAQFSPGIAVHLGPGAMGVAVFEGLE